MIKKYYCFPSNKKYKLLYSSTKDFNLLLFKSLRNKITPRNSWRIRLRQKSLIDLFFQVFFSISIDVPRGNIRLVYDNGNKYVYFEFKDDTPIFVYHLYKDGVRKKEKFKGYHIIHEYSLEAFKSSFISKFLHDHWKKLKKNKHIKSPSNHLHGDLTHFNILIKGNKIYTIDKRSITNSILFDHFYFYAYLMQSLENYLPDRKTEIYRLKDMLNTIYSNIFRDEDQLYIQKAIDEINLDHAIGIKSNDKKDYYYNLFKRIIIKTKP